MTSKREKLAAARKRLKEFQGKDREVEISKEKPIRDVLTQKIFKDDFLSNDFANKSSHLVMGNENGQFSPQSYQNMHHINKETTEGSPNERKKSGSSSNELNFSNLRPEYFNYDQNLGSGDQEKPQREDKHETFVSDCTNGMKADHIESVEKNHDRSCLNNMETSQNFTQAERDHRDNNSISYQKYIEAKEFFDSDFSNKSALNETIKSLERELQSHAQTIAILVQQRNDAQTALNEVQSLLNKKTGEAEGLHQQIAHLTSSVNNLTSRLFETEALLMKSNQEKEENLQKWNESKILSDNFQVRLDGKEEELQEMKRKYEEKNNDCQQLLMNLQETQGQLSFYQIQLQQHFNEGPAGPAAKVSELQRENAGLKEKIIELERKLEMERAEKEESSQKFHTYAQQCNSQLSSLNSQLKALKSEKQTLAEENVILSRNLSEIEKAKETAPSCESYENEIADLHSQLNVLSEENRKVNSDLKDKEGECTRLESEIEEKESELNKLYEIVKELSDENKKLESEAETPKANERLLATMESDKIAAAKAVSQNQKLKNQVIELEQAFMKLSEEKLELTEQLAHEKHVNGELQNMLKNKTSEYEEHHHHHHHHHQHHSSDCRLEDGNPEPLVNDSNEIEELRSIIRQLQDDKMELSARLNSYESDKKNEGKESEKDEDCDHECKNETQCENTKLLLQQMKEKVRKTMNEIAVLDEEKEKLEHLVLQLQGETETIGEYITLYQKQRMLLRQRAQEKDSQLLQLSRDKDELKSKLTALDELVQRLLAERGSISIQPGSKLPDLNSSVHIPENTAGKIRALINEIGSTTLISNQSIAFEHCSCCSGRLITI